MKQNIIYPAPKIEMLRYLANWKAHVTPRPDGSGHAIHVRRLYHVFDVQPARERLAQLESDLFVRITGRGRNRTVRLTPDGRKFLDAVAGGKP